MNIIPSESSLITGNYWCTWSSQFLCLSDTIKNSDPVVKGKQVRDILNEDTLFNSKNGLLTTYRFNGCRKDLIVVLDDGWDVTAKNFGTPEFSDEFGSVILNREKFPSFAVPGNPAESLKRLNDYVKSLGYRGIGLWIALQKPRTIHGHGYDADAVRAHFTECAKWCRYANVLYWKIDWGFHCNDIVFRRAITEACRKNAPDLLIENAWVRQPVNCNPDGTPFSESEQIWGKSYTAEILKISDVFRTYDVTRWFQYASTLMRVAMAFVQKPDNRDVECHSRGIINVEHMSYIGASLGMSIGMMYHERIRDMKGNRPFEHEIDASFRALRWSRIAAPFSVLTSENHVSDEYLTESLELHMTDWPSLNGVIKESAPAVISRNCPLPEVKIRDNSGRKPFVTASLFPNGAYQIATHPRTDSEENETVFVRADVAAYGANTAKPIGIFGEFNSLTIYFQDSIEGKRVFAQDILGMSAEDCTESVLIQGNKLHLNGNWIDAVGLSAKTNQNDTSQPGLVLLVQ